MSEQSGTLQYCSRIRLKTEAVDFLPKNPFLKNQFMLTTAGVERCCCMAVVKHLLVLHFSIMYIFRSLGSCLMH